ncbi:RtcB family protein [Nonomuraea sp. NPDC051941]|uniref:RtcB family protein n=1 Tax=Nonomuraea sp. NPDC051941 TaxID=3364373 RepID=UPI0037C6F1B2
MPGVILASRELLPEDQALQQIVNVAALPGIVRASYARPDLHWGYGFPIGDVVSPGGAGFDISCGVHLLAADIDRDRLATRMNHRLLDRLDHVIPQGAAREAVWHLAGRTQLERSCTAAPGTRSSRATLWRGIWSAVVGFLRLQGVR